MIYHQWNDGTWGAFIPDVPDVCAVADTWEAIGGAVEDGLAEYAERLRAEDRQLPPALHAAGTVTAAEPRISAAG